MVQTIHKLFCFRLYQSQPLRSSYLLSQRHLTLTCLIVSARFTCPQVRRLRTSSTSRSHPDVPDYCTPKSTFPRFNWRSLAAGYTRDTLSNHTTLRSSVSNQTTSQPGGDTLLDVRAIFGPSLFEHSLVEDVLTVWNIRDVKTDIGFARAFVRLALEKKLLSAHLTQLLLDVKLLRKLYSRYAFLRCEEEREQFLLHLLSLNAVDYYSFTRMLSQAQLVYRVYCCTGRKYGLTSTANSWIRLHGHLGSSPVIVVPRGKRLVEIRHSNLGLLSVLQIGHDNTGPTPKLYIESVLVHNVITNHLYIFPCGHWIGRGIEDDALERLLIGERVRLMDASTRLPVDEVASVDYAQYLPARVLSIGSTQHPTGVRDFSPVEIHERLANAVNQLLKHSVGTQGRSNTASLTYLWCGKNGLIPSLQLMFEFGFRSARLFQRRLYLWDYLEKVAASFALKLSVCAPKEYPLSLSVMSPAVHRETSSYVAQSLPRPSHRRLPQPVGSHTPSLLRTSPSLYAMQSLNSAVKKGYAQSQPNSPSPFRVISAAIPLDETLPPVSSPVSSGMLDYDSSVVSKQSVIHLVQRVQHVAKTAAHLGKEGRFQRFIIHAIRDHSLVGWISAMAISSITEQMYDPKSFLLNDDLRQTAQSLIASLDDFEFPLKPILLGEN